MKPFNLTKLPNNWTMLSRVDWKVTEWPEKKDPKKEYLKKVEETFKRLKL